MSKKYKIVVSDIVVVQVKGALSDENGKPVPFKFNLNCKRVGAEELSGMLTVGDGLLKDFMQEMTTGWSGQRLVLEDDNTPAEFSADAFAALLDIGGMAMLCFNAYLKEQGAKEKN